MDQLLSISTLSIAELRKILSDNTVQDTSESREELQSIVSDTLLTKMMINQLQEETEQEYLESVELSRSMERSRLAKEQQDRGSLLQEQELEYSTCVQQDLVDEGCDEESDEESDDITDEPLSPNSVRQKRLDYFNQ
jgi:hypothetical protein